MQQAMLYTFLLIMPMMLLSGLPTPVRNMPRVLQIATYVNPLRFAIDIVRRVYLEGAGLRDVASTSFLARRGGRHAAAGRLAVPQPSGLRRVAAMCKIPRSLLPPFARALAPCVSRHGPRRMHGGAQLCEADSRGSGRLDGLARRRREPAGSRSVPARACRRMVAGLRRSGARSPATARLRGQPRPADGGPALCPGARAARCGRRPGRSAAGRDAAR